MEKILELKPIIERTDDFERMEERIKALLRKAIYDPLIREFNLPVKTLTNSLDDVVDDIRDHEIFYHQGRFRGKFSATISRELKDLGAEWDAKTRAWKLRRSDLPMELRAAISGSEFRFKQKVDGIDRKLSQILPEEIAGKLKVADLFDRTLWKTDHAFRDSMKAITIEPKLPPEQRKKIADEWENNMRLWVKDFTELEIKKLRADMKKAVFTGNRYETAVKTIQKSFDVTANKAKFLARQETSLLMAKFKETRYSDAGVKEYKWGCVAGSKLHPVRHSHKILEGKIFRWSDPPITTAPGEPSRWNNPGQDYNCRCFAKPIVRF